MNNPLRYIDPLGLMIEFDEGAGSGIYNPYQNSRAGCMAQCFAKRQLLCLPFRGVGAMAGVSAAAYGSAWSGGASFTALARPGAQAGSFAGGLACTAMAFSESCSEECKNKDDICRVK